MARDSEVKLTVSQAEPEEPAVPNVVGLAGREAAQQLRAAGLSCTGLAILTVVSADTQACASDSEVQETYPPAGTTVAEGADVTLRVVDVSARLEHVPAVDRDVCDVPPDYPFPDDEAEFRRCFSEFGGRGIQAQFTRFHKQVDVTARFLEHAGPADIGEWWCNREPSVIVGYRKQYRDQNGWAVIVWTYTEANVLALAWNVEGDADSLRTWWETFAC